MRLPRLQGLDHLDEPAVGKPCLPENVSKARRPARPFCQPDPVALEVRADMKEVEQ
jgi:hypothetical protein